MFEARNTTLKRLSLCDCGLTDAGASAFGDLLRRCPALDYCWLMDNSCIGDAGAGSQAAALTQQGPDGEAPNTTLRSLYLQRTGGSHAVREAHQNSTIFLSENAQEKCLCNRSY